jgi:biopolymer transport protein ExbD
MAFATASSAREPLSELNTTPLIDVMLVLLIMFIMTIPVATHSLEFPLPGTEPPVLEIHPVKNRVTVSNSGEIFWNGDRVSEPQLGTLLTATAARRPEPQLQIAPESGASYATSARVLRLVKASGAANVGFVGNERYRKFGR